MYKTSCSHSPAYLTDLISKYVPSRSLLSRDADLFYVPRTFFKYGDRRFSVCESLLCKNLPDHIKNADLVT